MMRADDWRALGLVREHPREHPGAYIYVAQKSRDGFAINAVQRWTNYQVGEFTTSDEADHVLVMLALHGYQTSKTMPFGLEP